jgi:hypothetical protein
MRRQRETTPRFCHGWKRLGGVSTIIMRNGEMSMTEAEVTAVAKTAVREMLTALGVDEEDPIEMQKDLAHLRRWRRSVEAVERRSIVTITGILVTGVVGALFIGIREIFR